MSHRVFAVDNKYQYRPLRLRYSGMSFATHLWRWKCVGIRPIHFCGRSLRTLSPRDANAYHTAGHNSRRSMPRVKNHDTKLFPCLQQRQTLAHVQCFYRATLCMVSVCPSVTLVNCAHMVRSTIMISSPYMAAT